MSVQHHLDPATVLRYASGDLDGAFAIAVATHLAFCTECRDAVRLAESVGGELMEREGTEISDGLFEQLMTRIDDAGDQPADAGGAAGSGAGVPLPLARHIGENYGAIDWKFVAPGVRQHRIKFSQDDGSSLFLLRIAPGKKVPEHGHGGAELTVVLQGAYRDAFGRFAAGDIADLDEHVEHQPVVESETACICLVATEAPTRFRGAVSQLVQRFVGI